MFSEGLALVAQVVLFVSLLALFVEGATEHFVKPALDKAGMEWFKPYAALLLGLLVAAGFQADIFTPLAVAVGLEPLSPWFGLVLTGVAIGRGSNYIHDIWPGDTAGPITFYTGTGGSGQ